MAGDGSDTCIRQWRKCINGSWVDFNNTPANFSFEYESCEILSPPEGGGQGGEGVPQENQDTNDSQENTQEQDNNENNSNNETQS